VVVWKRSEIVSKPVGVPAAPSLYEAPVFEPPLKGSGEGRYSEPSVIALGKVELLKLVSEAL
jgi:hypothetical protein